ncbi:peptidoglycan-binding protein [Rhizobium arsenicireducens]
MELIAVQTALLAAGYDPGPLDNLPGRKTSAALNRYQAANRLPITGLADTATISALIGKSTSASALTPPWIVLAAKKKGLHESRDKASLISFLKLGKGYLGDPTTNPWCGDFVETCLAIALPKEAFPANPYAAINWVKFGMATTPRVGAVMSFHRGDPKSWQGHVGFYVGEDSSHFHILGGNQSNAVTVSRIAKTRLRPNGSRWPSSYPVNTSRRFTTAGNLSITINEA